MEVRGLEPERSRNDRWVEFLDLESSREKIAKDLSKGTRQKLMLASAFIHEPDLFSSTSRSSTSIRSTRRRSRTSSRDMYLQGGPSYYPPTYSPCPGAM